jgi:rhodanese-related sulfurtransferase
MGAEVGEPGRSYRAPRDTSAQAICQARGALEVSGALKNRPTGVQPMPINQAEPPQAHEILKSNPDAIYLDVRTEPEFAQGHPDGAINVPVVFIKGPGQMELNGEFVEVVAKTLPREKKLVVGCLAGGRSQRACELLEAAGYADLTNVRGGFGGARDASGQLVVAGWRDAGLPVSTAVGDNSYQALRRKAGL